ncbi:proteasome adapter and scaffold protein ECM29-like isoform X2 [Rhopilema esculentum]|uniref:proteasome adapter and scaffold protein ECM29-like isoform X2 n=1 Tax=Rhopilema esculentum TaxID=499914 RepID=UPI0031D1BEBF
MADGGRPATENPNAQVINELELVEKVFLKIVLADTDEKLEKAFATFLAPVLLKLGSNKEVVKNKVIELLTHINKRLKSSTKIKLPLESLLKQYEDKSTHQFVTNFTLIYIRMGFKRLELTDRLSFIPRLFQLMKQRPRQQQEMFLQMIVPLLNEIKLPDDIDAKKRTITFFDDKQLCSLFLDFSMDFLFLPYSNDAVVSTQDSHNSASIPAGLSKVAFQRFKFDPPLTSNEIEQAKLGILKITSSEVLPAVDVIVHFVVATGDSKHSVSDKGEHCIKRLSSAVDWEKSEIVDKLLKTFQGTVVAPGNAKQALTADQARSPASMRLKMKIFPYIIRSRSAANRNPAAAIKIIFESLFGEETNARLKKYAVEFCHHLCLFGSEKTMSFVSPLLYQAFIKIISDKKQELKLRSLAYSGLGKLSKRATGLFKRDIALVQKLFNVLEEEEREIVLSVQEALSMIAPAYHGITGTDSSLMETLILSNLEKESSQARLAALQFANGVFPVTHVPSRYACLLSSTDVKDDVREEAKRGLKPSYGEDQDLEKSIGKYPSFAELCDFLHIKIASKLRGSKENVLVFPSPIFEQVLLYLRQSLHAASDVTKQQLAMEDTLKNVADFLNSVLETNEDVEVSCVGRYIGILKLGLVSAAGASLQTVALEGLLEVAAALPERIRSFLESDITSIKVFMKSSKENSRSHAARILSIILESVAESEFVKLVKEMIADVNHKNPDIQHGAMLGLAYCIARRICVNSSSKKKLLLEDMDSHHDKENCFSEVLEDSVKAIAAKLSAEDNSQRIAACDAIGAIGRYMPLPIPDCNTSDNQDDIEMPEKRIKQDSTGDKPLSKEVLMKQIISMLDSKETRTKEKAAKSLGYIMIGEPKHPYKQEVLKALFETAKARQLEFNFTVGEALSCIGAGCQSFAAKDKWLLSSYIETQVNCDRESMLEILKMILTKHVTSTASYDRQAAAVWLLSIVKFSPDHLAVKETLESIQAAFMELLSSNDEITQDVASRGISLIYEQVSEEVKDKLVSQLVERLTTGKRPMQKVDENTQLFRSGQLGSSPDGGSLSTYKELCSLASSLNQPDLIYKFMNLANHSAVWNSRKGAAFGFLGIASQAGKQLEPFLPQLIPKLYRYQYDPNPDVQKAMANIWSSVVPNGKKSLDKYTKEIARDLIDNMTNYQWRIRESSCMALNDLIRSAPSEDILDLLPEIWETNFKVLDDIKESVRNSATICCKSLSKVTTRVCDITQSNCSEKAVALALPVLLNVGLASKVDAVKAISLQTMVQISKSAGKKLKPQIAKLVIALLESLSGLEPQYLNTLDLQLSKSKDAQEKLDAIRVSASKSSPMMDTINMCVQYIDPEILTELVPGLSELIKTGIGLGTKVGCANFVISLTIQCRNDLQPFAGKLLASLLSGFSIPNNTVKRSYANAIGHLVMFSKDSSVEKLVEKLKGWYMEKEDTTRQLAVAWTFQRISRHSPDVLKSHAAIVLPLVFLAMHQDNGKGQDSGEDSTPDVREVWEEVWGNATPGTQSGIKLYIEEIVEILTLALSSQSWKLKSQAARAIKTMADSLGASLSQPNLGKILLVLQQALPGRTWDGKDQILKALSSICIKCKEGIQQSLNTSTPCPHIDLLVDSLLKECRKDTIQYKMAALDATGDILEQYEVDRFKDIVDIVDKFIMSKEKKSGDDDDDIADKTKKDSLISCCIEALGKSWPSNQATQEKYCPYILEVFIRLLNTTIWRVQLSLLRSIERFFNRLKWKDAMEKWMNDENSTVASIIAVKLVDEIVLCLDGTSHMSVRLQGMKSILEFLQNVKDLSKENLVQIKKKLEGTLTKYRSYTDYEILQVVDKIFGILKI